VEPTAFIFHLSRCGSTLVSQLLSLDEQHIVLPEVPFFDELLRSHFKIPATDNTRADGWLTAAVCFYGQQRTGKEKRLFIKTDCWHIFYYERLRKIYPDVPIILLYRSPDEVLRSQQKKRGMQAVPGIVEPEVMGIKQEDINYTDFDHYFSMVMEKILEKFSQIGELDPLALLVNYNEGIIPVVKQLAAHCGMQLEEELLARMNDRSRYHAKFPEQSFAGDELPDNMPGYLDPCMQWYQQLEKQRLLQRSQDKPV